MRSQKPAFPLRLLLQILSGLLCLILFVSLIVTAIVLDVRTLTNSGNLRAIVSTLLSAAPSASSPSVDRVGTSHLVPLSSTDSGLDSDIELPTASLTDASLLTDYIYDIIRASTDEDTTVTRDQVQDFINQSTIRDYTSEKIASYLSDSISGQQTTVITSDELMALFEENSALMEDHFDIAVTDEMKANLRTQVEKAVEEDDINGNFRQGIDNALEQPIEALDGLTINDLMAALGELTGTRVISEFLLPCLVMIGILMALNFYNLPMGLTWSGISCLAAGGLLSVAVMALGSADILAMVESAQLAATIRQMLDIVTPVHYGMAIVGILMIAGSVVWRVLFRKRRAA